MELVPSNEDRICEVVLEFLSQKGRQAKLYRLPRHELRALLKVYGAYTVADLSKIFVMTQHEDPTARDTFLKKLDEGRVMCMLYVLVNCMKCWVESESPHQSVRSRWRIGNT